jgi:hypothetical protein
MLQADPSAAVGNHLVEHTRPQVWRDHDAMGVPLAQPPKGQAAAAKTKPIAAVRHPDHRVDKQAWRKASAEHPRLS